VSVGWSTPVSIRLNLTRKSRSALSSRPICERTRDSAAATRRRHLQHRGGDPRREHPERQRPERLRRLLIVGRWGTGLEVPTSSIASCTTGEVTTYHPEGPPLLDLALTPTVTAAGRRGPA
jgi:hypothetical protein